MQDGFSIPEIEEAALSAMSKWRSAFDKGVSFLRPDHFQDSRLKRLFTIFRDNEAHVPIGEFLNLENFLTKRGLLEQVGGRPYLTIALSMCHSPEVMDYYIKELAQDLEQREVITTCTEVAKSNLALTSSAVAETISRLEQIPVLQAVKARTLKEAVSAKLDRMEHGETDALKTGLAKLDQDSPLRAGDMPLISGERKSGKSVLALTIALNIAKAGTGVLYFSLEDNEAKVVDRLLSGLSRVPMQKQFNCKTMSEPEQFKSLKAAHQLRELPITIRDDVYDLPLLLTTARAAKNRSDVGLIVIDYAQLVRAGQKKEGSREQEVAHVSRSLRLLAMELETPILLLSQLNQDGFARESRALEQDATAMWQVCTAKDDPHKRWIEIPWQRNGESAIRFPVTFIGAIARVENYEEEHELAAA